MTPFFDLVLVFNPGAAFSFLSTASGWQRQLFIVVALAASGLIVYLLRKHAADRLFCFALSFILGGAVGNLIDRLYLGAVVDFLHFHIAAILLAGVQPGGQRDHLRRRLADLGQSHALAVKEQPGS